MKISVTEGHEHQQKQQTHNIHGTICTAVTGTFISVFILTVDFFVNDIRVDWIFYEFYYGVVNGTFIRVIILTV